MLALPMPFLYKLNLPTRKKIALIGMFAIGIMLVLVPERSRGPLRLTRPPGPPLSPSIGRSLCRA